MQFVTHRSECAQDLGIWGCLLITLLQQTHRQAFVAVPELDATGGELTRKLSDLLPLG